MSCGGHNGFDEWGGYMHAKITKLEEQFSASSDPFRQSNLFEGISIYVNGLTDPSADELKRIMMIHGGTFHHYQRSHTTFIIASNLPDVKVRNMNTSKIIHPRWVVECVQQKRIVDYTNYLLYTNEKVSQPRLTFNKVTKKEVQPQTNKQIATEIFNELQVRDSSSCKEIMEYENDTAGTSKSTTIDEFEIEAKFEQNCKPKVQCTEQEPQTSAPASNDFVQVAKINKQQQQTTNNNSVARTAVDPKFLSEFYNNSRLHHIASLGAGFKQYVSKLRDEHGCNEGFPQRFRLKETVLAQGVSTYTPGSSTCIMHIDLDCFFVSVGLRKHPHLRGQPVAVTHSKGGAAASEVPVHPAANRQKERELFAERFQHRLHNNVLSDKARNGFDSKLSLSEIASCSYEARATGVHNGMFVGHAMQLCPNLKTIPYDFDDYKEVAFTLYDTIAQYTLNIEAVSCDEMFVDLKEVLDELQLAPMDFVSAIRTEVRQKTGCPCSVGVGANKLQARMATKRAKPDGQYYLLAADVEAYMANLPISELPGVGSSTTYTLKEANLVTCGDLQKISLAKLQMLVGKKLGVTMQQFCRGIDKRTLAYEQIRKSVSAEVNYGIRFTKYTDLENFLRQLSLEVHTRLSDIKRKTKCITLKVMVRAKEAPVETSKFMGHGLCDNVTKSVSLTEFTNDLNIITRTVLTTMKALALPPNELRGIGIQLSKLDEPNKPKEFKANVIQNMFNKASEKQKEKKIENPETGSHNKLTKVEKSSIESKSTNATTFRKDAEDKKVVNVIGMLHNAAAKKLARDKNENEQQNIPTGIDPNVFRELPEDIRAEILQERVTTHHTLPEKIENTKPVNQQNALSESDLQPSTSKAAQKRHDRKEQMQTEYQQNQILHVDEEFMSALPAEIRAEIEMQLMQQQQKLQAQNCQSSDSLPQLPPESSSIVPLRERHTNQIVPNDISLDNIFIQKNCKELLLAWVKSCLVPENYDIELICSHARELIRAKKIYQLYEPLLYLCRLLNMQKDGRNTDANCDWHLAYKVIIDAIQAEMSIIYNGNKLYIGDKITCVKCIKKEI